jgi:aminopeptidase N
MNAWLYQGGYPIVFVDYDRILHQFVLTQTPKLNTDNQSTKTEWPVPVWTSCAVQSVVEKLHWILPGQNLALNLINLTETIDKNAVIFNQNQVVYYKLVYRY